MNHPNQSYARHSCQIALQGVLCPTIPPYPIKSSQTVVSIVPGFIFKWGLHGCSTPIIALTVASCSPTLHFLSIMYFNVYIYSICYFHQWWVTPFGLLPWDNHQTMTSVLVWDSGRPKGWPASTLVPVGPVIQSTAATCLAVAVACPHYGPNTTKSLSMGQGYIYSAYKSNQMALMCIFWFVHS